MDRLLLSTSSCSDNFVPPLASHYGNARVRAWLIRSRRLLPPPPPLNHFYCYCLCNHSPFVVGSLYPSIPLSTFLLMFCRLSVRSRTYTFICDHLLASISARVCCQHLTLPYPHLACFPVSSSCCELCLRFSSFIVYFFLWSYLPAACYSLLNELYCDS